MVNGGEDPRLTEFVRLFNAEKFFEAHEVLEGLWLEVSGPEKDLWQGLIQIAAALVHVQRGNPEGARSLYRSASKYLEPFLSAGISGINIPSLLEAARFSIEEKRPFPKILRMS